MAPPSSGRVPFPDEDSAGTLAAVEPAAFEFLGESADDGDPEALVVPAEATEAFPELAFGVDGVTSLFLNEAAHPISAKTRRPRVCFEAACMVHPLPIYGWCGPFSPSWIRTRQRC